MVPLAALFLVAIRFVAPSASAALGVQGWDTSGLDAFIVAYDAAVPLLAALLAGIILLEWRPRLRWDRWYGLAVLGTGASLLFWAGEVTPGARLVTGAWSTLPLALAVSGTILSLGVGLDVRLGRAGAAGISRRAFRALYASIAAAYLLGGLRFIDYREAVGTALPAGALWTMDYAPTLIPCFVAIGYWFLWSARSERSVVGGLRTVGLPFAFAAAGVGVAEGLGGFILSNVLAWGGGYEAFVPTTVSLGLVGFAVGAFLAAAWVLRRRMSAPAWRLAFCGVWVTALAGILFFDAALASLGGILLGLLLVARSLHGTSLPRP